MPLLPFAKLCNGYLLVALSLDRWYSLFYPIQTYIGNRSGSRVKFTRILGAVIIIICFCLNIVMFFVTEPKIGDPVCRMSTKFKKEIRIYKLVVETLIPIAVLLISYLSVIYKESKMNQPQRASKMSRLVAATCIAFAITTTPRNVFFLIRKHLNIVESLKNILVQGFAILNMVQFIMNFYVYMIFGGKSCMFRNDVKKLIGQCKCNLAKNDQEMVPVSFFLLFVQNLCSSSWLVTSERFLSPLHALCPFQRWNRYQSGPERPGLGLSDRY